MNGHRFWYVRWDIHLPIQGAKDCAILTSVEEVIAHLLMMCNAAQEEEGIALVL